MKKLIRVSLLAGSVFIAASRVQSAPLSEARINRIQREVQITESNGAARQAAEGLTVRGSQGVRTGPQSAAELLFPDQTLARLGSDTLFTFETGTRKMDLRAGTLLFQIPKGVGGASIRTGAITAAITGTTGFIERGKTHYKLVLLEGTMRVFLNDRMRESMLISGGQMLIGPIVGSSLKSWQTVQVDTAKLMKTSRLLNGGKFAPLSSEATKKIDQVVAKQQVELRAGGLLPTNLVIDGYGTTLLAVENAAESKSEKGDLPGMSPTPTPEITPTPTPTPTPNITPTPTPNITPTPTPNITPTPTPNITPTPTPNITPTPTPNITPTPTPNITPTPTPNITPTPTPNITPTPTPNITPTPTPNITPTPTPNITPTPTPNITPTPTPNITPTPTPNITPTPTPNITPTPTPNITPTPTPNITPTPTPNITPTPTPNITPTPTPNITPTPTPNITPTPTPNITPTPTPNVTPTPTPNITPTPTPNITPTPTPNITPTPTPNITPTPTPVVPTVPRPTPIPGNETADYPAVNDSQASIFPYFWLSLHSKPPIIKDTTLNQATTLDLRSTYPTISQNGGTGTTYGGSLIDGRASNFLFNSNIDFDVQTSFDARFGMNYDFSFPSQGIKVFAFDKLSLDAFPAILDNGTPLDLAFISDGDLKLGKSSASMSLNSLASLTLALTDGTLTGESGSTVTATASTFDFLHLYNRAGTVDLKGTLNLPSANLYIDAADDIHLASGSTTTVQRGLFNALGNINLEGTMTADYLQLDSAQNLDFKGDLQTRELFALADGEIIVEAPVAATPGTPQTTAGFVSLEAANTITVSSTIAATGGPKANVAGAGAKVKILGKRLTGTAISITSTGQLQALLNQATIGPSGTVSLESKGGAILINGNIVAPSGTIDIRNTGANGAITFNGATLSADVVKAGALGTNGQLNIRGGTISADTLLKLYAGGSNGTVRFQENTTLNGESAKIISANTVQIDNQKIITINGSGAAQVFTNNPNFTGSGGNGTTTGTFGGQGATTRPQNQAPGF